MSDEIEYGPDASEVRQHQKKMLSAIEYARRYSRINYVKLNPRQLEFLNLPQSEVLLRGGNQTGKTTAGAIKMGLASLGLTPSWYKGREWAKPAIVRPVDFVGWAGSTTSVMTRDGLQLALCGDITQEGGLGTGWIPLDNIVGRPTMTRGISGFIDTLTLRREDGGKALLRFKTSEMGRQAWQGEAVDLVWLDEDFGDDEIYGEALARLTTTRGQLYVTMTPVLGRTPIRRRFDDPSPDRATIKMTIEDATHIRKEDIAGIIGRYKESERATRAYGDDMAGEGRVFEFPEDQISHTRDPATFPAYWQWLAAIDFSHAGMSASAHPFAYVVGARDPDTDVIYITHALRLRQMLPPMHVAAIKELPVWDARVAWPHDGSVRDLGSGQTYAATYKKLGLNMLPEHATFPQGGYSFEAGIAEMEQRFATGRLKIAKHLTDWFGEFRNYIRQDGLVLKVEDDLLSATRQLCMAIRCARPLGSERGSDPTNDGQYRGYDPTQPQWRRKDRQSYIALGTRDNPLDWEV